MKDIKVNIPFGLDLETFKIRKTVSFSNEKVSIIPVQPSTSQHVNTNRSGYVRFQDLVSKSENHYDYIDVDPVLGSS